MSTTLTFPLGGLSCASCVGRAERALGAAAGVEAAAVNLGSGKATVTLAEGADLRAATAALQSAGYPAATRTVTLDVTGMSCASCVGRVEKALAAVPGVVEARVNLASARAHVEVLDGTATPEALAAAVAGAGYAAAPHTPEDSGVDRHAAEVARLTRDSWLAGALTLPVFLLAMGTHAVPGIEGLIHDSIGMTGSWWVQFILATAVLAGPGRRFFVTGIPALLKGAPEMNALVALGTAAAWGYSTVALLAPGLFPAGTRAVYFEAAAVICTLILLGRLLEARAKGRAGAAIARLVGLRPEAARVERDGTVEERPIADVRVGDLVHLRPGERVAVDGTVVEGRSYIDESMITGEPVPVEKAAGAGITGGTVNGSGALTYCATAVGEGTVLARIIELVEQAQGAKLPIQRLVDRVTGVFVPVVIGLALLTVALWLVFGPELALVTGVSVLIIACPCAMGLATPTSIMVGTGRAAELGVLFRKGDALQTLNQARVVAFDKTGTLTEGRPALTTLVPAEGWSEAEVLAPVAAVEARSEHPVATALVRAAKDRGIAAGTARDFEAVTGMGAQATVEGRQVVVGAGRFLDHLSIPLGTLKADAEAIAARGETPLFAAIDGVAVAAIGVSDPLKPGAKAALAALVEHGVAVALITGDNAATARAIADRLGIARVVAEVLPGGKLDALKALRAEHGPVAFVGDGINDAPALAEADTGIAIGTGTDVAIEAADVVLMSGDPRGVATALELSHATMRNIKQNLFWAFAYNAALIPVAAGLLYPVTGVLLSPMLAAGAMAFSSVFVVSNALRLRRAGAIPDRPPAPAPALRPAPAE